MYSIDGAAGTCQAEIRLPHRASCLLFAL